MKNRQKDLFGDMKHVAPPIRDGDKVALNTGRIMSRKDYDRMQSTYKRFIEESKDKIFTAHCVRPRYDGFSVLIEFLEDPTWRFVQDDLVKIKK